jgi:ElaB/YqjD/DUF883 family membrane-anchored ribosome-binding protein
MTSPELDNSGPNAYGGATGTGVADVAKGVASETGRTDDVSFAKNIGVDQTSDKVKSVAQRGIAGAEDAMSQLQAKASEFTSKLMDRVDVDDLTQKLEDQVRAHPTRTLLFAAGAGFLLGRAAKK